MPRLTARILRSHPMGWACMLAALLTLPHTGCVGSIAGSGELPDFQSATANQPAEIAPPTESEDSLPALPADPTLDQLVAEAAPQTLPETSQPAAPITVPTSQAVASDLEELARITALIASTPTTTEEASEAPSPSDQSPSELLNEDSARPPAELPNYVQLAPALNEYPTDDSLAAPLPPTVSLAAQLDPLDTLVAPEPPAVLPLMGVPEHVQAARSLDQLIDLALANHPALAAGSARLRAAQGQWVQAGLRPNPQVGYIAEEVNSGGTAGLQGVGVSRTLITGGKLDYARSTADGGRLLATQQLEIVRGRVIGDVRLAYYDALAAQERVELSRQLVDLSEEAVDNVQKLLNAGFAGQADVLRAQVEVQSNRVRLTEALARQEASLREIAAVTGQPHLDGVRLTGSLATGPANPSRYTWQQLLARVQSESPEISAAVVRIERARRAYQQACSIATPNVNAQVALLFDDETDDWVTSAGISMPLMINNRNQGNIMQAQAQMREAEAALARIELSLQRRLAAVYADYSAAQQEADRYRQDVLPLASRSRQMIFTGFEQGEQSYLDYLAAQRTDFDSQLAYLAALQRQRKAEALLDSLLLSGGLSDPPQ